MVGNACTRESWHIERRHIVEPFIVIQIEDMYIVRSATTNHRQVVGTLRGVEEHGKTAQIFRYDFIEIIGNKCIFLLKRDALNIELSMARVSWFRVYRKESICEYD